MSDNEPKSDPLLQFRIDLEDEAACALGLEAAVAGLDAGRMGDGVQFLCAAHTRRLLELLHRATKLDTALREAAPAT